MPDPWKIIVRIEKTQGIERNGFRQITIDCRDNDHAEAVGKILTAAAEKEKEIAQRA